MMDEHEIISLSYYDLSTIYFEKKNVLSPSEDSLNNALT